MTTTSTTTKELWILGATGRSGRGVATALAAQGLHPVLCGRDQARLTATAQAICTETGYTPATRVFACIDDVVAALPRAAPAVVVNTVGPFVNTALPLVRACPPGTHYVDLSNEAPATLDLLGEHDAAVRTGRTLVSGAGFGVLGTESVVTALCAGRSTPVRVAVDAVPVVQGDGGVVGEALAATIIDGFDVGGMRARGGVLVRSRLGSEVGRLTLPDGTKRTTLRGMPFAELEAARRASGAPDVTAGSSEVPSGGLVRLLLPVIAALLSRPAIAQWLKRRFAAVVLPKRPVETMRSSSWSHARVEWADGTVRVGWLQTGDAMDFTLRVMTEVVARLARGEGRAGAYTPAALFGAALAEACGGTLLLDAAVQN